MHADGYHPLVMQRGAVALKRTGHSLEHRVNQLEVARIGDEDDAHRLSAGQCAGPLRTQMILDVAGATVVVLALELVEDRRVRFAEDVREHVQPPAVRHRDGHGPGARGRAFGDGRVEHGDERIGALDREALGVRIRPPDEPLQPVDFGQPHQHGLFLIRRERPRQGFCGQELAEPFPLILLREMRDLDAEGRRIAESQPADDIGSRSHVRESQRAARHEVEVPFSDPVELGCQLRRAERRRTQGVELYREMAVGAGRLHEGGRPSGLFQQDRVRGPATGGFRSAALREPLRNVEELPP